MRPKILSTDVADYERAEWSGKNESGMLPFGDAVMILPDKSAETAGKMGLIHITEDQKDRMTLATESGVIIATGEDAFQRSPSTGRAYTGRVPRAGDRVLFARYSGRAFKGQDGVRYIIMTDSCVGGIEINGEAS
jgi:co-chaperonin GroES (HSP10)